MSGSYNNSFKVYDIARQSETTIELSKSRPKPPVTRPMYGGSGGGGGGFQGLNGLGGGDVTMEGGGDGSNGGLDGGGAPPVDVDDIDFSKKCLHYTWHPKEDIVAVTGVNNLFLYSASTAPQLSST